MVYTILIMSGNSYLIIYDYTCWLDVNLVLLEFQKRMIYHLFSSYFFSYHLVKYCGWHDLKFTWTFEHSHKKYDSLEMWAVKLRFVLIYKNMLKSIATARSECTAKQENKASYNRDYLVPDLSNFFGNDWKEIKPQTQKRNIHNCKKDCTV